MSSMILLPLALAVVEGELDLEIGHKREHELWQLVTHERDETVKIHSSLGEDTLFSSEVVCGSLQEDAENQEPSLHFVRAKAMVKGLGPVARLSFTWSLVKLLELSSPPGYREATVALVPLDTFFS